MSSRREMNADVFDTMDLISQVFGGIGAGPVWENNAADEHLPNCAPWCMLGAGIFAENTDEDLFHTKIAQEFVRAGVTVSNLAYMHSTDILVLQINRNKGVSDNARVSWPEFCAEYNIVRKPHPWEGTDKFGYELDAERDEVNHQFERTFV